MNRIIAMNPLKYVMLSPLLIPLFFIVMAFSNRVQAAIGTCTSTTMSTGTSPDKLWTFTVVEGYCDGAYTFDTVDVYRVIVSSLQDPAKTEWVYQDDAEVDTRYIPTVTWSGQHTLRISAPRRKYYQVNKPLFTDVPINIIYR